MTDDNDCPDGKCDIKRPDQGEKPREREMEQLEFKCNACGRAWVRCTCEERELIK